MGFYIYIYIYFYSQYITLEGMNWDMSVAWRYVQYTS